VLFHGREALPVLDGVEVPIVVDCGDTNCTRILQEMRQTRFLRARLSTEGRRFVEAHCSWSCSAEKLEKLCLAAAENHRLQQGTGLCRLFAVEAPKTENTGPVSISPDSLMRSDRASTVSIW